MEDKNVLVPPLDPKIAQDNNGSAAKRPSSPPPAEIGVLMESLAAELSPEVMRAFKKTKHIDENQFYSGQFAVSPGLYLHVKLLKGEPALGDQVMKRDHFEGVHRLKEKALNDGAPNFRRVDDTPLFGVAHPTLDGIAFVLDTLKADKFQVIKWINLREEPVSYINGHPYSPRDPETLNVNLDHLLGIEGLFLEDMEERLKADILAKTRKEKMFQFYQQRIDLGNVVESEAVLAGALRTPREAFEQYKYSHNLEYYRIPITDECAPEEKDFDQLVEVMKLAPFGNAAVVFNCQMGRGRTTTGLVCGYLILQHIKRRASALALPPTAVPPPDVSDRQDAPDGTALDKGEFQSILTLISHLEDGASVKRQVDDAIDACAGMQNLRTAILDCKQFSEGSQTVSDMTPAQWKARGKLYMERYWWLILFNSYLVMEVGNNFQKSFSEFMRDRWGMRRLLRRIELK